MRGAPLKSRMAAKGKRKKTPTGLAKEISVLAWIQDAYGSVLLVRQTAGRRLWSLPGGKVRATEPLLRALRRELREEIGLTVLSAKVIDLFDRPPRAALAVLFQTVLRKGPLRLRAREISEAAFLNRLPARATPSVRHFWARHFTRRARKTTGLEL